MSALYILTVERDTDVNNPFDPACRPIAWEQYLDQGAADLENVRAFAQRLGGKYGQAKIARLVFEGEPGFDA